MTDQELNNNISRMVGLLKTASIMRPSRNDIDEYLGKWDELLIEREKDRETYENLLDWLDSDYITNENKSKILEFKANQYLWLLCDLAKCYEALGRYIDSESVLLEGVRNGSDGASVLLMLLYAEHMDELESYGKDVNQLLLQVFERVKSLDILSETVTKEICNGYYHGNALLFAAKAYIFVENDVTQSHSYLIRELEAEFPDEIKEAIENELKHYKKGFFGGYKYIE